LALVQRNAIIWEVCGRSSVVNQARSWRAGFYVLVQKWQYTAFVSPWCMSPGGTAGVISLRFLELYVHVHAVAKMPWLARWPLETTHSRSVNLKMLNFMVMVQCLGTGICCHGVKIKISSYMRGPHISWLLQCSIVAIQRRIWACGGARGTRCWWKVIRWWLNMVLWRGESRSHGFLD